MMQWQRGFKRIRLVAACSLALGVILLLSVFLTTTLGYSPDPSFAQIFSAFWPLGLMLLVVGALLWLTTWVLAGFLPDASARAEEHPKTPFYR